MADKKPVPLAFGDTAKFLTDELGVSGTIVIALFEDGRFGITTDGLNGNDVQNALATGIYMNMAEIIRKETAHV